MAFSRHNDPQQNDGAEPLRLALFGGGRWGTIVFDELCKHAPANANLVWVTRDAHNKRNAWQRDRFHNSVEFIESWEDRVTGLDGAFVVTSIDRHYRMSKELLTAAVPVLCEKPLAPTREQLDHLCSLANQHQCPFGINLEFAYLTAFDDFLIKTRSVAIERIQVEWFDPEFELRDGVEKRAEYQCDIVSDQWPHVWSLVSRIANDGVVPRIDRVEYSPQQTRLIGTFDNAQIDVKLSRRYSQRRRHISFNDGEATFDFRIEPPSATLRGQPLHLDVPVLRPLAYSIRSFLTQIFDYNSARLRPGTNPIDFTSEPQNPLGKPIWPLSVNRCYEFLVDTFELSERLKVIQEDILSRLLFSRGGESHESLQLSDEEVQMVLDRWLPQGMASGARYRPGTKDSDRELAMQIARSLYQRR